MPRGRPKSHIAPCRFCKKEFKRLEHLQRHERTHTREKPFECYCGQQFSRKDLLVRHGRIAHSSEEPSVATDLVDQDQSVNTQAQDSDMVSPDLHSIGNVAEDNSVLGSESVPSEHVNLNPIHNMQTADIIPDMDPHMNLGPIWGTADELDFLWNNDAFGLNSFLPAQFLDTDVSLSDLSQQFPAQNQNDTHGSAQYLVTPESQDQAEDPKIENHHPPLPPRFPSLGDELQHSNLDSKPETTGYPWAVSSSAYKKISDNVVKVKPLLSNFSLPSRYALSRYLEGYFRGFHDHFPFLHQVSFDVENVSLELIFSLTALGALYRFESAVAYQLYGAARALIDQKFQHRRQQAVAHLFQSSKHTKVGSVAQQSPYSSHDSLQEITPYPVEDDSHVSLQLAQSLIILMAMSAWGEECLMRDSIAMGSELAIIVRELGINQVEEADCHTLTWSAWASQEERRRTLLVAYIFFNLQSITFNLPPMILSQEVALRLPSCEAEWKSPSSSDWERQRALSALPKRAFAPTLKELLMGVRISDTGAVSSFSNYLLIHGIVQKVILERQAASSTSQETSPLRPELLKSMEAALIAWQASWEVTWESTLDPLSPKGPLGFNATALLRLAHIRLNADLDVRRELTTHDSTRITHAFTNPPIGNLTLSPHLDRAVLQCIHALSIPVRVGITYISRTQTPYRSIQHSLCNLECAFLLTRWLQTITITVHNKGLESLREDEKKLIAMTRSLVGETHLRETLEIRESPSVQIHRLAASTARLWAEVSGGTQVFKLVHTIGETLGGFADVLEGRL